MRWVLAVLMVLVMVAAGCSGDGDDTASDAGSTSAPATTVTGDAMTSTSVEAVEAPTATVPSAAVIEGAFTFADDDLCEWVSEGEVAEFVAAEFEWDGTAVLEGASEPEEDPDSCKWMLTGTAGDVGGDVLAGNPGKGWGTSSNQPWDYLGEAEVVAFDEEAGSVGFDSAVSGHPSLSDGVIVENGAYGRYLFWVPPSDEYLGLSLSFEDSDDDTDWADWEDRFFGVADRFVQELGWLG